MVDLTPIEAQLCEQSEWDFSDLSAVYINCTLKRSPEISNTQALADRSIGRGRASSRPRDRDRGVAGHDRARVGPR